MEMDLAPFVGGLFDEIIVAFVVTPSWVIVGLIWLVRLFKEGSVMSFTLTLQVWSRVALDSILIMGICGTSLGIMGMIYNSEFTSTSVDYLYESVKISLLTFAWGGLFTGLAFVIRDKKQNIHFHINSLGLSLTLLTTLALILWQCFESRVPLSYFFLEPNFLKMYAAIFFVCLLACIGKTSNKSLLEVAVDSNITATLGGIALGVCLWFVEGGNYDNSRDAIFLVANFLFVGSIIYLLLYFVALHVDQTDRSDWQTKTWHFAEAASFFIFLIYAPVGATEYLRESTDQANQQANNEAQELRIEQLEAQNKLLTEKVGEV